MSLKHLANKLEQLRKRKESNPLDGMKWLPGQYAVLKDTSKRQLFRAGNQIGKSHIALCETIYRCLGEHPYKQVKPPPIEAWIICASWSQSLAIQEKLWNLLPKGEIDPDTTFDRANGFRRGNPIVKFKNGSIIRFKTTQQGGLDLAGATIDWVVFDEPPKSPAIYSEVANRLRATNGDLLLSLTPINAPCDWLKELVEEGKIKDHHYPLTVQNMIPVGETEPIRNLDGEPRDSVWIQRIIDEQLPSEIPVRIHGEFEQRVQGRAFEKFISDPGGDVCHVTTEVPEGEFGQGGNIELTLGIDHGAGKNMSSVAVLVALQKVKDEDHPRIWVLDEYVSNGETTPEQDARAIVQMLKRNGLKWEDLDRAFGDRVWYGAVTKKSNGQLMRVIARDQGLRSEKSLKPQIKTVKRGKGRGAGSVDVGVRYLHWSMLRPEGFHVHKKCERMIECLNKWDLSDNEYKHIIDALRYALDADIFGRRTKPSVFRIKQ